MFCATIRLYLFSGKVSQRYRSYTYTYGGLQVFHMTQHRMVYVEALVYVTGRSVFTGETFYRYGSALTYVVIHNEIYVLSRAMCNAKICPTHVGKIPAFWSVLTHGIKLR
jgi:hypothetical protein